jgi:hypothetical protein
MTTAPRRRDHHDGPSTASDLREEAGELLARVGLAEAAGDPAEALRIIETSPVVTHSPNAYVLRTLVELGDDAPGWLWSRWITIQAHRGDLSQADPGPEPAIARAIQAAYVHGVDLHATPDLPPEMFGVSLFQFDWIVRQLRVYDQGELRRLVEERAASRLLDRADGMAEWIDAPMRGLVLADDPFGPTLRFTDLGTGEQVELLDLGLGCEHEVGQPFIGRLVPTAARPGVMFEWRPLPVDLPTAKNVAALGGAPHAWVEILAEAHVERRLPPMYSWYDDMTPIADISCRSHLRLLREHQLPRPRPMGDGMIELLDVAVTACANALRRYKSDQVDSLGSGPLVATALLWPGVFERVLAQLGRPQFSEAWSMISEELPEPARGRAEALAAAGLATRSRPAS